MVISFCIRISTVINIDYVHWKICFLGKEAASMKKYCEECGKEVETQIITKRELYDVCGETIDVDAQ